MSIKRLTKEELKLRPWLFQAKYDEVETPVLLIQLMEEGFTNYMLMRELKIRESTFYQWLLDHPEFKAAYEYGKSLRAAYHDSIAMDNYTNPKFNLGAWERMGKRYYGFTEYRTVEVPGLKDAKNYMERTQVTLALLEKGELSPNEALILAQTLNCLASIENATDFQQRLTALEKKENIEEN